MFQTKKTRSRCTIGLLAGWPVYGSYAADRFVDYIAQGLQKLTLEQDCNLLLGLGVNRLIGERSSHAAWPQVDPESDFIPVGPWNTDGLIVLSPIRSQARTEYLQEIMSSGFPVVFIGNGGGRPSVMVDNQGGIRLAMAHLVEHGHRRIAFLAGDTNDPGDSLIRLNAYHNGLQDFQIEPDPALVSYGFHNLEDGYRATKQMLRNGVTFSALLASNDMSAIGAMKAIREQGLRIPEDIAVIGFDDQPMAAGQDPPLTSVHYPLFEAGYQAGNLLMQSIRFGRDISTTELLLTPRLACRHSCGCSSGKEELSHIVVLSTNSGKGFQKETLVNQMVQIMASQVHSVQFDDLRENCEKLTDAYIKALTDKEADAFHQTLTSILSFVKERGEKLHVWQEAITMLAASGLPWPHNAQDNEYANMLLHRARVEISESIEHQQEQTLISQNSITHQLSWLSAYLFEAQDESEILRVLARLPLIGIKFVHVAFFEPELDDVVARVRYRIPSTDQTLSIDEGTSQVLSFPTREFPPAGIFPKSYPYQLAILPLVFQDEAIGFVVFESSNLELYAAVVRELAAALKSAALHAKVLEMSQTDSLTRLYNRRYFDECFAKELERSKRYDRPLAVVMIDLDLFKDYNDALGHQAGDQALEQFANVIQNEIRRNLDIAARYGGEEFVIVMPESNLASAFNLAERIRSRLESLVTLQRRLTTSIGVAANTSGQTDWDTLVSRADRALYQAKNSGRNRVCS